MHATEVKELSLDVLNNFLYCFLACFTTQCKLQDLMAMSS